MRAIKYRSKKLMNELIAANTILSDKNVSQETKQVVCMKIEQMLFKANNYHGFQYIAWLNGGFDNWRKAGSPKDTRPYCGNEYDRFYY